MVSGDVGSRKACRAAQGHDHGRTGAIGVLLVEAALNDASLLIFKTLGPIGRRGRASSIRGIHDLEGS